MATVQVCDERHPNPTRAEYRITVTDESGSYDRDYCHAHMNETVQPLTTGGMKPDTTYTMRRL